MAGFKYFDFETTTLISVKVRGTGKGYLKITTGEEDDKIVSIPIDSSNDWQDFGSEQVIEAGIKKPRYFTYMGEGSIDFKSFCLKD